MKILEKYFCSIQTSTNFAFLKLFPLNEPFNMLLSKNVLFVDFIPKTIKHLVLESTALHLTYTLGVSVAQLVEASPTNDRLWVCSQVWGGFFRNAFFFSTDEL